jgi:hypothetical protein
MEEGTAMPPVRDRDAAQGARENSIDTIVRAETLRGAERSSVRDDAKPEDRIGVFWRVFGGTLLSITALVAITLYQQFSNALSEVRNNVSRLNESRGDLVKTDDFNNRTTALWNSVKEVQQANTAVTALKERTALFEQQVRTAQEQVNGRLAALANNIKDLDAANAAIIALKERSALLEQQVKLAEQERKDLVHELQLLRERQAALEGRQAAAPAPRLIQGKSP